LLKRSSLLGVQAVVPAIQDIVVDDLNSSNDGYKAVFASPWAADAGIETKHLEISKSIWRWSRRQTDQQLDFFQMVILCLIILLMTEDTGLNPGQKSGIEDLQLKYILMYQRYLKWAYPKECNFRLTGGLMLLHHAKELELFHSLRLPV